MEINLNKPAKNVHGKFFYEKPGVLQDGSIVVEKDRGEKTPLSTFVKNYLDGYFLRNEKVMPPEDRYNIGKLCATIGVGKKRITVSVEDVALIKAATAEMCNSNSLLVQIWDLVDPPKGK